jgi:hypothetical protein
MVGKMIENTMNRDREQPISNKKQVNEYYSYNTGGHASQLRLPLKLGRGHLVIEYWVFRQRNLSVKLHTGIRPFQSGF